MRIILAFVAAGLCASAARAQVTAGPFTAACGTDAAEFCPARGGGDLVHCLFQEAARVSAPCLNYLAPLKPCAAEAQSLCFSVAPGEGRLYNCLLAQRSQLSKACSDQMDALQGRSR